MESRFGITDVPPFICSCTSTPFTMNPFDDSRCPAMETLPGFKSPDGLMVPVTPAIITEVGVSVLIGLTPGWIASKSV